MNTAEKQLYARLNDGVDSFENFFEDSVAAPIISKKSRGATSGQMSGGAGQFSAQFDILVKVLFFTVVTATGVYTSVAPAALNAGLKNSLPMFLFGNSDYASGFKALRERYPVNANWVGTPPFVWGTRLNQVAAVWDATVTANLKTGDLVIPYTSALPAAGTTSLAIIVVRCDQVGYGTLLNALNSDRFVINKIRYIIPTVALIGQYANQIGLFTQSLFGKFDGDYISPNSYKKPENQQSGIIDMEFKWGIDKNKAIATYCNYDVVEFSWSLFVWSVTGLKA
jgi:hypothetical protein